MLALQQSQARRRRSWMQAPTVCTLPTILPHWPLKLGLSITPSVIAQLL